MLSISAALSLFKISWATASWFNKNFLSQGPVTWCDFPGLWASSCWLYGACLVVVIWFLSLDVWHSNQLINRRSCAALYKDGWPFFSHPPTLGRFWSVLDLQTADAFFVSGVYSVTHPGSLWFTDKALPKVVACKVMYHSSLTLWEPCLWKRTSRDV